MSILNAKTSKQLLWASVGSIGLFILFTGCLPPLSQSTSGLVEASVETSFWDNFVTTPSHILIQFQKDCGSGPVPEAVGGTTNTSLNLSFDPRCNYNNITMSVGTMNGNSMSAVARTREGRELSLSSAQLQQHVSTGSIPLPIPISALGPNVFKTGASTIQPESPSQPTQPQQSNVSVFVVGGESCGNCEIFESQGGQYHVMQSALSGGGNSQATKIFYNQIQSQNISASMKQALTENAVSWPSVVAFNSQGQMCFSQTSVHQTPGGTLADNIFSRCQ